MSKVSSSEECTGRQDRGLKCVYFNAKSIQNKVGELAAWVGTWDFDVVAISDMDREGTGMVVASSGV